MVRFSFFKGPHAERCHTGMVIKDPLFGFYLGPFPRCDKMCIRDRLVTIQDTARAIGELDAIYSLAMAAFKGNYVCPRLSDKGEIIIKDGRHPVVEKLLERELFVPNDVHLNGTNERLIILTGPNMAGKSTYMRQVALLVLMTQMGSFLPCREAVITPVDRIFTRVGASDDLATGQSTFMAVSYTHLHPVRHYTPYESSLLPGP